ncbi:MAG TPA: MFS transporter, partial [Gammaproteobacteria bacterium]|nr:MFS transporter [Gammaproteobacteria bacterium]
MTPTERRAALSLASIFALRMLGLFMILPVFSLYAHHLKGVTPALIGLAIGVYGLTQAVLQIPFGLMSDRFGRKPMIAIGMIIFAVGSAVAAMSDSIGGVIMGRALQGVGAVASVVMALAADLTREEHRTKAMALIGTTIGMSFVASLVAGPILNQWIGVPGIFWLTAVLALFGVAVLQFWVPRPTHLRFHHDTQPVPAQLGEVLRNGQLGRLDVCIFALHMMLTATFVAMPLVLRDHVHLAENHHWYIYLPVMVLSLIVMVPMVIIAEKRRRMKQTLVGAVVTLAIAELVFWRSVNSLDGMIIGLLLFFTAFNVMEAILPSYIAKVAPPDKKGSAMGAYSTSQFLGAFAGGAIGGWLYGAEGLAAVFAFCALAAVLWAFIASTLHQPPYLSSKMLNVGTIDDQQAQSLTQELLQVPGVKEAV